MSTKMLSLKLVGIVVVICVVVALALGIRATTPVGTLRGRAVARESGVPLRAEVFLTSVRSIAGEQRYFRTTCDKDGNFVFRGVPAGNYLLRMHTRAHTLRDTKIAVVEGQTATVDAGLEPDEAYLRVYVHEHVFAPGESPHAVCEGFVDADSLDVKLYKVDLDALVLGSSQGDLSALLGWSSYGWMGEQERNRVDLASNKSLALAAALAVPIMKRDAEGVFTQRVSMPTLPPGLYAVSFSASGVRQLDWLMVTSLGMIAKTAGSTTLVYTVDIRTGTPVSAARVTIYAGSKPIASGVTDRSGLANIALPFTASRHAAQAIIARSGESLAFITAELSSTSVHKKMIYSYTDRPVYRPGQVVFYKGIVRTPAGAGYATPTPERVVVEVYDPNDTLIYRTSRKTDRFGSYYGAIHLDSEAPTGYYNVRTRPAGEEYGEASAGFSVSAYRKPEFSVKLSFDKRRYTRGDWVTAKVMVSYYFGAPVANAKLYYSIQRTPYWPFEDGELYGDCGGYSDYGGYGEWVDDGQLTTNENGEATIVFPATWPQPTGREACDADQEFHVSVTAEDRSESAATGEGSVIVTRGQFAIGLETDARITKPGASVNVTVTTRDYDKRPVKHQKVSVTLARETWSEEDDEITTTTLLRRDLTTNSAGRAVLRVPISQSGSLIVAARSRDSRGNAIVSTFYLWSCGEGEQCDFGPVSDIQIIADKREYASGDTAKVLVLTNRPGGTALVTLEGSRVYEARTVRLTSKSSIVRFKVKAEYMPNFYITVSYLRGKQVMRNETEARIAMKSEALNVKIEPDRKRYKPGQKASYSVKVTDSRGKPVSAQLSIGVVDEAIYAVQPDTTTPILEYFYQRRDNEVRTYDSLPQIYLSDPDKAGAPLKDQPPRIRVRKRFLDTAYWNPAIVTDANGEARVSFVLPDNLTTWRATVRAVTENTMCGQATNTVTCRQDMLVRLEIPRFLVQRDRAAVAAVVHNYTGRNQRVEVRLRAPGLHIDGDPQRTVYVRSEDAERIDWYVTALKPGVFGVDVRAVGETAGDEVLLDLPVKPHGRQIVTAKSAVLANSGTLCESIYVRNDAVLDATRLRITLAPSLAAAMFGSLDYLAQYPYGCTEQTVSSFLPDVILFKSLSAAGMPRIQRQTELPEMVRTGLGRLYKFQLYDGGWSWCAYGEADPWMTAYVCYALVLARDAGFPVKTEVLNGGLRKLEAMIEVKKIRAYPRAFGAYVLALAGRDSTAVMERLARYRYLPNEAVASLALGFDAAGRTERAQVMLGRLFAQSISDEHVIYWKGGAHCEGGDVEATALALRALLKISPGDPRAYPIVRWLMSQWRDEYWTSTRATAMAVYAMSQFLRTSGELTPDYTATVFVNGRQVGSARFGSASIYKPHVQITVNGRDLRKGRNELKIVKAGSGNLYHSSNLTQSLDQKSIPAILSSSGLTVTRGYYRPSALYFQNNSPISLGNPVDSCSVGETILVRLTIKSACVRSHIMLEDYIPAGCEIVTRGDVEQYAWSNWWVGQDVRDDKIAFYINEIDTRKRVVEYQIRGGFAGSYCALPAQAFSMYDPNVQATTAASEFTVR